MADTSSKLLINESPLQVLPSLVSAVGMEKALILQQIQYLVNNKANGRTLDDGFKYIWNTAKEFVAEYFPFWKPDTVRKHLRDLEKEGFLICCQPLSNQRNQIKFYRINYEILESRTGKLCRMESEFDAASNRNLMPHVESEFDAASLKEAKTPTKTPHTESARSVPVEKTAEWSAKLARSVPVNEPSDFTKKAVEFLEDKSMISPFETPAWLTTIEYAERLSDGRIEIFRNCIESIEKWAKFRITPETVANHFGKYLSERKQDMGLKAGCDKCENHPNRQRITIKTGGWIYENGAVVRCECNGETHE